MVTIAAVLFLFHYLFSLITLARPQAPLCSHTSPDLPKRSLRRPAYALARDMDFTIELVNLLEREAFGFIDHEIHKGNAYETAAEPDEEDLGLQVCVAGAVVYEVGRGVSNCPVKEPVGGGCHAEGFGADFEWEDLAGYNPIIQGHY